MNADISYNEKVENQRSVTKAAINQKLDGLCVYLDVRPVEVLTSEVEPQDSETSTWLLQMDKKLELIIAQVVNKEVPNERH